MALVDSAGPRAAELAKEVEESIPHNTSIFADLLKATRKGSTVIVNVNATEEQLLASLFRGRARARRVISATNLYGIGKAIKLYQAENNDVPPPTLANNLNGP